MDALGFVLILVGLLMFAEQVLTMLGWVFIASAIAGFKKAEINWWLGRAGSLLAAVGAALMYFS